MVLSASASRDTLPSRSASNRRAVLLAAMLLGAAVAVAYATGLTGPFVYDDKGSILYNGTIRHLWPLSEVFHPPGRGATVGGRPILNLTFAANFALGGLGVRGYHVANVLIHLAGVLTLFGLIRRTLRLPTFGEKYQESALTMAFVVAGLWAVHPLNTEAVTYVSQRAESLMSLFFLLTLYGFVRSVTSTRPTRWYAVAWVACLLGMGTKENMAAAPLSVLLFDRAFVSGSLREAWRRHRRFLVALGATWIFVGALVLASGGDRGGTVGFDVGVSWIQYLLTQIPAVVRYAALSFWPSPLVFDYGVFHLADYGAFLWQVPIVAALIGGGGYALWRYPKLGFISGTALAILAPTSLMPGTTQMIVEHRMYLPLAAVVALAVPLAGVIGRYRLMIPATLAIMALALTTAARNRVYRNEIVLWSDAVAKRPDSLVAHSSLGAALASANRRGEAIREDRWVLARNPNYAPALANLGIALTEAGEPNAALPHLIRAVALDARNAQAQLNLGVALDKLGRAAEALPHYAAAVQLNPMLPEAQNDYGDALCRVGRVDDGIAHLKEALRLAPAYADADFNLAAAFMRQGKRAAAEAEFARVTALQPGDATPHLNWGNFLWRQGDRTRALAEYAAGLRLRPNDAELHFTLATALAAEHRLSEAIPEFETAIRLRPDYAEAHNNLGNALLAVDRAADAIPHYQQSLRSRPDDAATHNNLGLALARSGQLRDAAFEFERAVQLAPNYTQAQDNLAHAREQLNTRGP